MSAINKTKEELLKELQKLRKEYDEIKTSYENDITECKKKEDQYILINNAVESTSDAIGISDAEGHHIYQNQALTNLFEYATAEEIKAAGGGAIVVKDPEVAKEMFGNIMSGKSWSGELEMVTKSGHVFPAYERANAIKDNDGNIIGLIGIITDISERKRVELALAISESQYRRLFETAQDGILILDAKNGMIMDVNPFLVKMLGYSKEQFLEKAIWEIGFFKDIVENQDKFIELQQNDYIRYENLPLETANGQRKNVEFVSNVYLVNSHRVIQCNIRDITDRFRAEEELNRKKEELYHSNIEKDKFFSIIAHDLRTPFSAFLGFTQIMAEELPTMTMEQTQKIALSMRNSATNLYGLLENLLEWTRLERGFTTFDPEPFLLRQKISESIIITLEAATKKEIEIGYNIPEDLVVFADKKMLGSIIRNLSSNAVKYTPKGGKINIAAKPISDECVEISITDTGIGISQEMLGNLFKLDINTSRKGTDNEPSTGLGLIICKEFIEKHNAKLLVESEEGKGSRFFFTIPNNKDETLKQEKVKIA